MPEAPISKMMVMKRTLTSSIKIMEGACRRARSKRHRTSLSDSPRYLLPSVALVTLKKVQAVSVATALASMVLPVPSNRRSRESYEYTVGGYMIGVHMIYDGGLEGGGKSVICNHLMR